MRRQLNAMVMIVLGATVASAGPPDQASYRARIVTGSEQEPPQQWTDIVVAGNGEEHKRACEGAVANELRIVAAMPEVKSRVVRECALASLPPVATAPGYLLVQPRVDGSALLLQPVRARVTRFIRVPSQAECAAMLARLQAAHREDAQRAAAEAAAFISDSYKEVTAKAEEECASERKVAARCAALPPARRLPRDCKGGESSGPCHDIVERDLARNACELELRSAQLSCQRQTKLAEALRQRKPPGPASDDNPPSCRSVL